MILTFNVLVGISVLRTAFAGDKFLTRFVYWKRLYWEKKSRFLNSSLTEVNCDDISDIDSYLYQV